MEKSVFVRKKMPSTDGWQCYRRKYGSIHSILVPLGDEWEWRHVDGDWVETKVFGSPKQADAFIKERYLAEIEIEL